MLQLKALTLHDLPRPSLAKNHQARTQLHLDRTRVKPNLAALIPGLSLLSSVFIYLACELWFLVKLEIAGFFLFLLQLEIIVFSVEVATSVLDRRVMPFSLYFDLLVSITSRTNLFCVLLID